MIDIVPKLLGLKKELPLSVGYEEFGPFRNSIPKELKDKISSFTQYNIRIDNFSNTSQKDIRITYSGIYKYTPLAELKRRTVAIGFTENTEMKEIKFNELPPNETINLTLFNTSHDFKINDVLINGTRITKPMQILSQNLRYPYLLISNATLLLTFATVFFCAGLIIYSLNDPNRKLINKSLGRLDKFNNIVIDNRKSHNDLEIKFYKLTQELKDITLIMNDVDTFEELKKLTKVVLPDQTN